MAKRKRRRFTPEFKTAVVLEALSGKSSIVLTLVSMFLLGGMQGVCYSQKVSGTVNSDECY